MFDVPFRERTDPPTNPVLLSNDVNNVGRGFVPKDGIDGMFLIQLQSHGPQNAELAFWIWLGDTPTLFALACCSRANRYMAYIWCDECHNHVLDVHRRLVTFPRDRDVASLVMCNSLCYRHSETDARNWTGPNKRTLYTLYGHPRTCACMPCNVCRFYHHIMP